MIVNIQKLKGKIVEHNKTQEMIADLISMDRSTFYRKMKADGETFSIKDAYEIAKAVPLSPQEAIEIFFASIVS